MKIFTLPDGREIYIPDDPNLRAEVGYALSQIPEYGPDVAKEYTEGTFIGQSIEALKSVPRGIAQTTLMGLRGPIEALAQDSLGEGPLVRLADKMKATEERVAQNIAGYRDPRYADDFSTKAGQAVGSLIPFVALGAASRGKSTKYMPVFKPGTKGFGKVNPLNFNAKFLKSKPFLYPAGLGSSVYMSQNADMMDIAEEVYGEEKPGFFAENLSTLTSSVIGASEAFPIFNFFRSIPKSALRDATTSQKIFAHAKNFTAGAVQEGLQESTAGLLQDLNARGFYSDELPIGESLFDDLTVGGFAGGLLNTVIQGYGGRRGIASEYRAEQEKRAEKKKQDLLKTKTFDIAQQQGVIDIADPTQDINVQETLLLPLLDNVPKPVETSTPPQLQIRKNQNNTYSLIDNNLGEVNSFNKEVDAINKKEQLLKDFEVNLQKQILDNDLYILGLNKSSSAYELAQTVMDTDTTTASLKEIVPYDSSLKNVQAMQNVLLGKNKKYKKLPLKESYTLAEVKQLLSAKDFNTFVTDMSQQVAKNSKYPSVIENNNKTNVTIKRLKEIGNSKNINIDVNNPAFQYAAKRLTGTSSFAKMTKPQKELLLARIQSLPRFNTKIDFPNLQPRIYSAQDVSETVANLKNSKALFNKQSLKMIGIKDPQFFEDLVYSGRAEKVKGNQYKIADNYQEKIDRRADAFNETTEEFVNRLVTEGKLSSEAIAQLEQEQNNKESQQLPPVEEAKRTIDFAEAVEKGRINKFAQELRQRLAKIGLKETGVIVSDDILSTGALEQTEDGSIRFVGRDKTVEAEYDRQTDIIFISLNAVNPNGTSTDADIQRRLNEILDHELIHALREKDLINEKEYDYLRKQVKKVRVPKSVDKIAFDNKETYFDRAKRINEPTIAEEQRPTPTKKPIYRSPAEINELYTEEAIAEMYRNRKVESPLPERAEGIFNKIIEFFAELGESLRISGFDNANQIFEEIEAGRIGQRTRDKIRTTKLLDKGPPPTYGTLLDEVEDDYLDTPLFSKRGPRDETSGHVADYVPAQYGPPAHDLNEMPSEELTPEGYSTFGADVDYNNLRIFSTARTEIQQQEEREFINKLIEIKDNPNAEITVYQAAPSRDLREGDLITPFLSDAQYLVDESKITRKEIREADKARRRAEGVVNLQQEKNFEAIDRIIDMFDMPDVTPSKVHTYKLRAGDIRWDGNNGWARWGYFPRIKPIDDIPTFSREADQAYFDREKRKRTISNLESSIKFKQAQLDAERGTMTDSSAKRLEREIKNQRQKIADLRAGDLPTFSRAATETQPPYMDFNRQQIRDFSSNRVGFYNGVEIPLTHVTRMNVDDFLKLSTISQNQIDKIIAEGPSVYGFSQQDKPGTFKPINNRRMADAVFDPEIADTALTASLPSLQIKNDGQVISHEGRHRVALIKQGGGRTVPVFIHFPEGNVEQNIPNPSGQTLQKQGVTFLKNQYPQIFKDEFGDFQTNEFSTFAVPINKLGEIAPLHRDSAQTKDKLDYAVQVATAPDILESTKDTVASASEYDIRMARFLASQDIPTFSRTNLIPEDIEVPFNWASNNRFKTGAIIDQLEMSREEGGNRDNPAPLKMAIVEAFKGKNNRPLLRASKKFLEKFTNKKGNLVLFRALNIPKGEKIKNYGQLPQDLFASTTLDSRQALKIGRNLFNRAQSRGETWNPEILRYEVPMSKVKGYVPMLLKAMESDYINILEDSYAGSGIMSQEELDAAIEEADEQGDYYKYQGERSREEYFEDDMYQYEQYMKEAEVLADLRGIKPTYQYSPATKDRQASLINDIPLFSRGRRDSKRKWSEQYYHVTETKNVKNILNKGFNPLSDTNFVRKGTGKRYQKDMGLFAFNNPVDAIAFFRSVMWDKELSDLTMLAIKKDGNWVQDPAQERGSSDAGLDNRAIKGLDSKITVIPESISKPSDSTSFNNIPTSFFLSESKNSSYFNNPNNILGSATLEELTQTKINPYFGKPKDSDGGIPQRFYSPSMDDLIFNRGYGNLASNETELATIITKYMNDIANRLNPTTPNKALEEVIETVNNTARGGIPVYNLNASDTALEAAKEFIEDEGGLPPDDIPTFSKNLDGVDPSIVEGINSTGSRTTPKNSMGYRFIDVAKDNISGKLQYFYNNFREQLIDKADKAQKAIVKMSEENEQVRRLNNTADTSTMAAIRLMDRARGIFQGMLNTGYVTDTIDGALSLINTVPLSISTRYNPFIEGDTGTGGLMQILAPLYSTETDLESIFKYYALLKRKQGFDKSGRKIETPITEKNLNDIRKIQSNYPVVVEAYQNYQRWNNRLIDFAVAKGLLSKTRNISELAEDISAITKESKNDLIQLSYEELMNKVNVLNKELSADKQIETRGTAQIWKENSDYYPFYRKMTDDTIAGPNIASGSLPNNPLNIKIEGSKEQIDVDVIEAISRNSLAILTAAMKNDGTAKLIRDMQIYGTARPISPVEISKNPKIKNNLDVVAVFNNGQKNYYEVENIEAFNVFKEVGGTPTGVLTNIFGGASSLLRDTVTRDPGFIAVNLLRDSLSTMVTSGANYTPIIDTFKSMGKDMAELEKFGVIGGYDFQNDEGSIKRYLKRNMRLSGLTNENGMSAKKAFFMLWDGLGNLTTKSDGATRLAVYNAVYKKLKEEGATEAQAQSEAAFQALEIINFGRRGANPAFRFITAANPFLNARVQGLDVLWRSSTGQYSAVEKLGQNETINDVKRRIQINMATNAGILIAITFAYYMMMHDDDEYKNLKREVRDDNWVLPVFKDYAIKVPVPFEVGFLFKTVPERLFDFTLGDDAFSKKSGQELITSTSRGLKTSLSIDTPQLIKPLLEVIYNRNSYTGQEIVPYYQQKKAPGLQARPTTNYLVKEIAEFLNISPAKAEHFIRGYTGTLGGHVLSVIDVASRGATGEDILPSNVSLNRIPLFNRILMNTDKAGGLQQQFYELRNEVDGMTQTLNSLKKAGRMDEYYAYRNSMQGVLNVKNQVRKMERYLAKWRERRDKILQNKNMSLTAKQDALERLELERDRRLAMVPELRKRANIPITHMGTF